MNPSGSRRSAAHRIAVWLLPAHRRDWADAMFNEQHYVSRGDAFRWAAGCVWTAVNVRITHELERTLMRRTVFKVLAGVGAALLLAAAGVYGMAKPYQRERIRITVLEALHGEARQPKGTGAFRGYIVFLP